MFKRYLTTITWIVLLALAVGCKSATPPLPLPTAQPERATSTPDSTVTFQLPPVSTDDPESTPSATGETPTEIVVRSPAVAANCADDASAFDVERALEHIEVLSSDEMNGRRAGSPGGRAAGDYIAALFAEYGLQPAGQDGDYFQSVRVSFRGIVEPAELNIISHGQDPLARTYVYGSDYMPITRWYADAGAAEGQVVWLSKCRHSDYDWQDVVGKIVLCRSDARNVEVYRQAMAHRAGGLLMVDLEDEGHPFIRSVYRQSPLVAQTMPAFLISRSVAEGLLAGSGYTLENLSLRFEAVPLSSTVRMSVAVEEGEIEARNVLGLLPGSDPQVGDEIIVIGAHYDHVGSDLGGTILRGANDNASGVAVLLEIARLWQEQGCRPARSVLFAAWDAEEMGLLGSRHYVQHPAFPISQTIANINMDMLGVGDEWTFDGAGVLATQLQASADTYSITATHTAEMGSTDHVPFREAGVSASTPGWQPDYNLHTPDDLPEAIKADKLRAAGRMVAHTLGAMAQDQVQVERTVERIAASIAAADREGFLADVDPGDPALRASQAAWFDDLWSRELSQADIRPTRVRLVGSEAEVTFQPVYLWDDARGGRLASYDVRFVQRDDRWYLGGYGIESLAGETVTVEVFPDVPGSVQEVLSSTQESYLSIAADLGMEPLTGTRVIIYSTGNEMRAVAHPATERDVNWLVPSKYLLEVSWGNQSIIPGLTNLILKQLGLPADAAPWLREGLASHYLAQDELSSRPVSRGEYLRLITDSDQVASIVDFPRLEGLSRPETRMLRAHARSAVEYLLGRYGGEGLQALCAAWGESGEMEAAFQRGLGLSPAAFESAWHAAQVEPLRANAQAIRATLAARVEAVLAGDEAAFMDTIASADAVLRTEERRSFARLIRSPDLSSYDVRGEIVEYSPGASEALVKLTATSPFSERRGERVVYNARFAREGGRWLYAGVDWNELAGEHVVVKYQDHDDAWAEETLELAERVYERVYADLGTAPPSPLEIKVYDDARLFRAAVSIPASHVTGWTGPGEAIKIWPDDEDEHSLSGEIAAGVARQALMGQGLEAAWLLEGVAAYEARRALPLGAHWQARRLTPVVQNTVRRHNELAMDALPLTTEQFLETNSALVSAQPWSLVSFIVQRSGPDGLRRFVARSVISDDVAANLRAALGVAPDAFWEEWQTSAYGGDVPPDLLELARRFDPGQALAHIAELSGPDYGGREAGTPGAELAAAYVAAQFAELGLEPVGDRITDTGESSYLQLLPISHTHLSAIPVLTLLDDNGQALHDLHYREEFLEKGGQGDVEGELVWLSSNNLEGLFFDGTVVVEQYVPMPLARANALASRGASGLIVVTRRDADDLQVSYSSYRPGGTVTVTDPDADDSRLSYSQSTSGGAGSIPVVEITEAAFEALLGRLGTSRQELASAPPVLPLGGRVRQSIARSPVTTTLTANVLGLLPGRDPALAGEVIVVGAHYDHVGQSPDGLHFPGANGNGSGVAVMLELARVWQEARYRPARSVLFVAWGAEEIKSSGAAHYLVHPAIPLTRTVGVIALDSVGTGRGPRLLYTAIEREIPLAWPVEVGAMQLGRRARYEDDDRDGWRTLFGAAAIPTLGFTWERARDDAYLPSDTVDGIDVDKLAASGEVLTLTASWLAGR